MFILEFGVEYSLGSPTIRYVCRVYYSPTFSIQPTFQFATEYFSNTSLLHLLLTIETISKLSSIESKLYHIESKLSFRNTLLQNVISNWLSPILPPIPEVIKILLGSW